MRTKNLTYGVAQKLASIFLMISLLWLTVSTPFVNACHQTQQDITHEAPTGFDDTNPFSNTTEEKTESSVSSLSEYLHEINSHHRHFVILDNTIKCHPDDIYFAFHPELISPPPEA